MEEKDKCEEMPAPGQQRAERAEELIGQASGLVNTEKGEAFFSICEIEGKYLIEVNGVNTSVSALIATAMEKSPKLKMAVHMAVFAVQSKEFDLSDKGDE